MIQRKTPLKSSRKTLKRSAIKKRPTPEATLKKKLWELCKQIIREAYGNTCYTCWKDGLKGSDWHTGHFIPSSTCGAYLRYDLRNLRPQCYHCNINLGGNGAIFYRNLVDDVGQAEVDQLFEDKKIVVKADRIFYESLITKYTDILRQIRETA